MLTSIRPWRVLSRIGEVRVHPTVDYALHHAHLQSSHLQVCSLHRVKDEQTMANEGGVGFPYGQTIQQSEVMMQLPAQHIEAQHRGMKHGAARGW